MSRSGVFISYARSDGAEVARNLRRRLEAEGVRVWQDRTGMEGGRDWWLQITEALDKVEFMALVITPGALASDMVKKECRYARQQGVCVYPVRGEADFDLSDMPRWLREVHVYSPEDKDEWEKFVRDLKKHCETLRVPFMAEDLPEGVVLRSVEFGELIGSLRDPESEEPIARTVAIIGAGGYGKTAIATAICHNESVQEAFDDGILWVTLGEAPGDLIRRLEDLIYILSGVRPGMSTLEAATTRLGELLEGRDLLIVIDDVWNSAHLTPFLQGGSRCARLITTRVLDTLPPKAKRIDVDAMTQEEAVALLGFDLPTGSEGGLRLLSERLGEWPLLLKLVNGVLRHRVHQTGQTLPAALAYVNEDLDENGLTTFDATDPEERNQAVARTLGASLKLLSAEEHARYGELAAFPEDAEVPLSTVERLWSGTGGLSRLSAEKLCDRLYRLSLLLTFDLTQRRVRLHDVLRKYLSREQAASLVAVHQSLLAAHRPATGWADLPRDEPYLWDWLAYHLLEARLEAELEGSLKDLWYLATKTWLRGSRSVEMDLALAADQEARIGDLNRLRQIFTQSSHLFGACRSQQEIAVTLHSRLLQLSELESQINKLKDRLVPPYLLARYPVPDQPVIDLRRVLTASDPLDSCAVSKDGRTIVAACRDSTLIVWDTESYQVRHVLREHLGAVRCCAISADGNLIISGSDDKTLKLWNAWSGEEVFTLEGHLGKVSCCCFWEGEPFVISGSEDKTIRIWDAESGLEMLGLIGHRGEVRSCSFYSGLIMSVASDGALRIWSNLKSNPAEVKVPSIFGASCCAFSPDGRYIIAGSFDFSVMVWDLLQEGRLLYKERNHTSPVTACVASAEGRLVTSSWDGTLKIWDLPTGRILKTLSGHTNEVFGCALNSLDGSIVSCSGDSTVRVWDSTIDSEVPSEGSARRWYEGGTSCCAVSPDGSVLVTASGQELRIQDLGTNRTIGSLEGHAEAVADCAISSDGKLVVSASHDKTLRIWDCQNFREIMVLTGHNAPIKACAISTDGSFIVSAAGSYTEIGMLGELKVWSVETGFELWSLEGHRSVVTSCAISSSGFLIASVSADGTLKLWDARTGRQIRSILVSKEYPVFDCALSPDSTFAVTANRTGEVEIWSTSDGRRLISVEAARRTDGVSSCALSHDGRLIASTGGRTLAVWSAVDGERIAGVQTGDPLSNCCWSPDGKLLVAVGGKGVYLFDFVM